MSDTSPAPQQPTPPEQPQGASPVGGQPAAPSGPEWQKQPQPPANQGWQQQPPPGQPPYNYGSPVPPQKKRRLGRGCLFGCLGAVVAVVVIVVVLVLVFANSNSGTSHPADKDVSITSCSVDPVLGLPTAKVEIFNHSSKASDYVVTVEFDHTDGTRVSQGVTSSISVAPGQKVETTAGGTDQVSGKVSCKVSSVTRLSSN